MSHGTSSAFCGLQSSFFILGAVQNSLLQPHNLSSSAFDLTVFKIDS